ncbi:hypothetical protein [Burkholderia gladioli]|uniref:hypothetical protein n=1 Tax=Burkholderia gladioli TaxID=28095 RepID=UPI00055A6AAD|nr:hypothetical protein [Burkholderia gladioli]
MNKKDYEVGRPESASGVRGYLLGIINRQLKSWGGLARLVILLVVLILGWLFYSGEWRAIASEIGKCARFVLKSDAEIDAEASELLRLTGSSSIVVHFVFANQRRVVYMRLPSGRERTFDGVGDVLWPVGDHEALDDTARLMAGEVVCRDYRPRTIAGEFLQGQGVAWVCAARAPFRQDGLVGIISLGFREEPQHVQYVQAKLKDAADAITE